MIEDSHDGKVPQAVQAVKVAHEPMLAKMLANSADPTPSTTTKVTDQGESSYAAEFTKIDNVADAGAINALAKSIANEKSMPDVRQKIVEMLSKLKPIGKVLEPNSLPKPKHKDSAAVDTTNIIPSGEKRSAVELQLPAPGVKEVDSVEEPVEPLLLPDAPLYKRPMGTRVRIEATAFDGDAPGSWSSGKPKWEYGTMVKKGKSGVVYVRWDNDDHLTKSHWSHLEAVGVGEKKTAYTVLATIIRGVELNYSHGDEKKPYPKYFFQCLVRKDWRRWVEAVQAETDGWISNGAYIERDIRDVDRRHPIIPLSELYSIKRDGRYKLRQIAMGNMLNKNKGHFHDT
jgi:hypothetical protein